MELRQLRYFVAVAEKAHFTRAAEVLHVAQPAVSTQIKNLEDELGVVLFHRSSAGVTLTEEGRAFLDVARRMLDFEQEGIQTVQRVSRGEAGRLSIGYRANFNLDLLPKTTRAFRQQFPRIKLKLIEMNAAEQLVSLEVRKIDLAFLGLRFATDAADLQWECVTREKVLALLPANHPLANRPGVQLVELKNEFFVALSEGKHPGSRDWLYETCRFAGFTPEIVQEVEHEPALLSFVAEGLGVTLAPHQIEKLPNKGVVFRPITPALQAEYWMVWREEGCSKALRSAGKSTGSPLADRS